jgi:hypothetical protein
MVFRINLTVVAMAEFDSVICVGSVCSLVLKVGFFIFFGCGG